MFRLTREIRFSINRDGPVQHDVTNGHGGFPTLVGWGHYLSLRVTLGGELEAQTGYLRNIKEIDNVVRQQAIPLIEQAMRRNDAPQRILIQLFDCLANSWSGVALHKLQLSLSPFSSLECIEKEYPMVRFSQKFEFSAAHRLHNPRLSDAENRATFGKCNNPRGHGHNYEVQVTLMGKPNENGVLIDIPEFERIVSQAVIERFDHKFLNLEVEEFHNLIPSVENIARVIHGLLKGYFDQSTKLASITVWETPKTWCEYAE